MQGKFSIMFVGTDQALSEKVTRKLSRKAGSFIVVHYGLNPPEAANAGFSPRILGSIGLMQPGYKCFPETKAGWDSSCYAVLRAWWEQAEEWEVQPQGQHWLTPHSCSQPPQDEVSYASLTFKKTSKSVAEK